MRYRTMRTKYEFFADAQHGWLKVSIRELIDLGIAADITRYSYIRGEHAYLEEDSDAYKFIKAKKEQHGIDIKMRERYSEYSRIRSYYSYTFQV